jgi:hypothetical protein
LASGAAFGAMSIASNTVVNVVVYYEHEL